MYQLTSNNTIHLVILILMATCVCPSDHLLAILEKRNSQVYAKPFSITNNH
jgi:hypothetical protein